MHIRMTCNKLRENGANIEHTKKNDTPYVHTHIPTCNVRLNLSPTDTLRQKLEANSENAYEPPQEARSRWGLSLSQDPPPNRWINGGDIGESKQTTKLGCGSQGLIRASMDLSIPPVLSDFASGVKSADLRSGVDQYLFSRDSLTFLTSLKDRSKLSVVSEGTAETYILSLINSALMYIGVSSVAQWVVHLRPQLSRRGCCTVPCH